MAQFDVYANPNDAANAATPYLLDVQTDMLDNLSTRVVVPLISQTTMGKPIDRLNPRFTIDDDAVFMSTPELAGVPTGVLGRKIASLKDRRDDIMAALDFLFLGF
jgi:toxin CcdB